MLSVAKEVNMTKFAEAMTAAGLVDESRAKKVSRQAERRQALSNLCQRVQNALARNDMKAYLRLKCRLPRHLRAQY